MTPNPEQQANKAIIVGSKVIFRSTNAINKPLKMTYVYAANHDLIEPFIIQHPEGTVFDDVQKEKWVADGHDVSKLKIGSKYLSVKPWELELFVEPVAPVDMITFVFPKSKWLGVVSLIEGQVQVFETQKMLLMMQPGMTEEVYVEMLTIAKDFLVEAHKL